MGINESGGVYFSKSRDGVGLVVLNLIVGRIVGGDLLRAVIVVEFVHMLEMCVLCTKTVFR